MAIDVARENGIYYLELEGSPREMGRQHGQALAPEIRRSIVDYKANVVKSFGVENAPRVIDWVLHRADFRSDIEKYVPNVLEEMEGLAEGAGVLFDDILLNHMFVEVYEAAPLRLGIDRSERFVGHGCTSFVCRSNGRRFNGQNMDYTPNLDGKQAMLRYKYPGKHLFVYGFIGQVGGIGINSRGVSVFVTTLPQGKKRESDGLGVIPTLRLLLEQDSVDGAIATLHRIPRFAALSYAIADFDRQVMIEASADEIVVQEATDEQPSLVHTNYILELKTRNDIPGMYEGGEPVKGDVRKNIERFQFASELLEEHRHDLGADALLELFTSEPVNMTQRDLMTLLSAVAIYDGGSVTLYASAGTDRNRGWNRYAVQ